MSTKSHEELPSIDPSQLSAVTGGVTDNSGGSSDLTSAMQQLVASIQDLSHNQNSGSSNMFMEMLPLMMMMRGQQAAQAPVEYPPEIPPIGDGSGWTRVA